MSEGTLADPTAAPTLEALSHSAAYAVKVPAFEGPLDLLLHLIRVNEVEITDIPIALIAEQYLEYLELLHELDLDLAGEYLVMAATLAWIKSRLLLPPDGLDEEGEGPDPRAELIARLLEYQRFKEVSLELGERHLLGRDVFEAHGAGLEAPATGEREIEVGLFELIEAFRRVLRRPLHTGQAHAVEVESVTVSDRMRAVLRQLSEREALDFEELLLEGVRGAPRRAILVATFLAVLELTRLALLRVYQGAGSQGEPCGPIHCRRSFDPDEPGFAERLAELL
jgi:segregation and condensation protein A